MAKRILFIVGGLLSVAYTIWAIFQFVDKVTTKDPGKLFGAYEIVLSLFPICVGVIVCLICFPRALKKIGPATPQSDFEDA